MASSTSRSSCGGEYGLMVCISRPDGILDSNELIGGICCVFIYIR